MASLSFYSCFLFCSASAQQTLFTRTDTQLEEAVRVFFWATISKIGISCFFGVVFFSCNFMPLPVTNTQKCTQIELWNRRCLKSCEGSLRTRCIQCLSPLDSMDSCLCVCLSDQFVCGCLVSHVQS